MPDERLKMLRWHHLKVELDNREKQWPSGSSYEFDEVKQTVTWFFEEKGELPERVVWHLREEDLSLPKPTEVADRIIALANEIQSGG